MFAIIRNRLLHDYGEYARRLLDVIFIRPGYFKSYDLQDGKAFLDASRYFYSVCSAALIISAIFYFGHGLIFGVSASRPEFYQALPLSFMIALGLVCFIALSLLRVSEITFGDFFICFAYVMGTYSIFYVLGHIVQDGLGFGQHDMPMTSDGQKMPGTRLNFVYQQVMRWESLAGAYFAIPLGVFLAYRARTRKLKVSAAILAGLCAGLGAGMGAMILQERAPALAAQLWLQARGCPALPPATPERSQIAVDRCRDHAASTFGAVKFFSHYRLAAILDNRGEREGSISAYMNAIKEDPTFMFQPDLPDRLSIRARGLAAQGYYDDALGLMNSIVQNRRWDARILTSRGSIYLDVGKLEEAMDDFNAAVYWNPRLAEAHFFRGWVLDKKTERAATSTSGRGTDSREALAHYSRAIELDPDDARFWRRLGRLASLTGDHESALIHLERALNLSPNDSSIYYEQAEAYRRKDKIAEAERLYFKAIEINEKYADAHLALARLYRDLGKDGLANEHYAAAISSYAGTGSINALLGRAEALFETDEYKDAVADYSAAIRINPREEAYYIKRGDAYDRLREDDSAIADYTAAIQINRDSAVAYSRRGTAFSVKRAYWNALDDLDKAIELDPKIHDYHLSRGLVWHALGEYPLAILNYTNALALNANLAAVWARRCTLRAVEAKGQAPADVALAESILADCEKALRTNDRFPERIWHYWGMALSNLGRKDEAKRAYLKAYGAAYQAAFGESLNLPAGWRGAPRECNMKKDADSLRGKARETRAGQLGRLSWYALFADDFKCALEAVNIAIDLAPSVHWPKSNRAHARMFLGEKDVARGIYLERRGETLSGSGPWEKLFLEEFRIFRESGLNYPTLIDEIEKVFRNNK